MVAKINRIKVDKIAINIEEDCIIVKKIIGDNKFIEKLRIIIEIDKESITDGVSFIDYDVGREEYHQYDYYKCTRMLIKIKVFLYPIIFYYFKWIIDIFLYWYDMYFVNKKSFILMLLRYYWLYNKT